jgi:hypothetical protein
MTESPVPIAANRSGAKSFLAVALVLTPFDFTTWFEKMEPESGTGLTIQN